jgi:ribosomal-protein-alanine N-acetyltransferase
VFNEWPPKVSKSFSEVGTAEWCLNWEDQVGRDRLNRVPNFAPIVTSRLQLVALLPATLEFLSADDAEGASRIQGINLSGDFLSSLDPSFLSRQLAGMEQRPSDQGWFVRAIVREEDGAVIGQCGFHGTPEDVGRAEIGYTVFEEFRRNGYAAECAQGLVDWAREQGTETVFAAVSTNNFPSIGLVKKLGFHQSGVPVVDTEGEMFIFELSLKQAPVVDTSC